MIKHIGMAWFNDLGKSTPIEDVVAILSNLEKMDMVSDFAVGTPLPGDPDFIEQSYDLAWMLTLESPDVMPAYRTDPRHIDVGERLYTLCTEIRAFNVQY